MALFLWKEHNARKNVFRCDCCNFIGKWPEAKWRTAPSKTKFSLDGLEHFCSNECLKKSRTDAVIATDEAFQEYINQGINKLPAVRELRGLA